jgi:hypothetical protein
MALIGIAALIVIGQVTLQDDFEGTLLESDTPPGVWSYRSSSARPSSLNISTLAAHSGLSGIRLTDSNTSNGAGILSGLGKSMAGSGTNSFGPGFVLSLRLVL